MELVAWTLDILGVIGVSDGDTMGDVLETLEDLSRKMLGDVSGREGDIWGELLLILEDLSLELETLGELGVDEVPASCNTSVLKT
mmetsp:Transcript_109820/g.190291  ORF Transcript_109820/g.190291 Transcript_109820/m.190291 type:complete len:85 (-) Transcript_109820:12-266(-)